jgi:hypothetical protein
MLRKAGPDITALIKKIKRQRPTLMRKWIMDGIVVPVGTGYMFNESRLLAEWGIREFDNSRR